MDMMEENETTISTVFSVCLQLVWFTWTRSVGSTKPQCFRNYATVTFSGLAHKLDNSTTLSGFTSSRQRVRFRNHDSRPESGVGSGILFKRLKAQPAAGVPKRMLGGTVGPQVYVSVCTRRNNKRNKNKPTSSCGKMQTVQ